MMSIRNELKKRLTPPRYAHVLRVAELAKTLARKYGVCEKEAEQAALFHDIAKCMDRETLAEQLRASNADPRLFAHHHELWHGPVGAAIARDEFGVKSLDVYHAVRYHTTGRAGMSKLEKVIYIADLLEPERDFPGVDELREVMNRDLDEAMAECIAHSILYLVKKRVAVFPDSFECYNENRIV